MEKTQAQIDAEVQAYSRAAGKQTLNAMLFFFVGLPLAIVAFFFLLSL